MLFAIERVARVLPTLTLQSVAKLLTTSEAGHCNEALKATVLKQLPNANFRRVVADLLETWQLEPAHLDTCAMAAALKTAAYCTQAAREALSIELVWTGPNSKGIPLRRTDQVLLQLIREAEQTLTIVSFVVYKVPEIAQAIVSAINRGVSLRIIAETPESGVGKIPFGVIAALGKEIAAGAQLLVWPRSQRPEDSSGKYGSLHVKCCIADDRHLFLTSANLTEYALSLNMEMGLLVHSRELASQVSEHIDRLIHQGILVPA
jgi:phosphatidylserine/phosphatidylglycerophosphate/cardiolipin synthase-like enzyme